MCCLLFLLSGRGHLHRVMLTLGGKTITINLYSYATHYKVAKVFSGGDALLWQYMAAVLFRHDGLRPGGLLPAGVKMI